MKKKNDYWVGTILIMLLTIGISWLFAISQWIILIPILVAYCCWTIVRFYKYIVLRVEG